MAIAGVFRRGEFTKAASVEERKKEWRLDCDQVAQFVDDRCVLSPEFFETSYKLYNAYEDWTKEAGCAWSVVSNSEISDVSDVSDTYSRLLVTF